VRSLAQIHAKSTKIANDQKLHKKQLLIQQQDELYSKQLNVQKKMLAMLKNPAERQKKMKEILELQKRIKGVKLQALKLRRESLQSVVDAAAAHGNGNGGSTVQNVEEESLSSRGVENGVDRKEEMEKIEAGEVEKVGSENNEAPAAASADFKVSMYEEYDEPVDFEDESSEEEDA